MEQFSLLWLYFVVPTCTILGNDRLGGFSGFEYISFKGKLGKFISSLECNRVIFTGKS